MADPLEGLERRPQAAQLAVLVSVVRSHANAIDDLAERLDANTKAMWWLLGTLAITATGIIVTLVLTRPGP